VDFLISVDAATGWGRITITGELDIEGFHQLFASAWSHPEYSAAESAIWDFRTATTRMRLNDLVELTSWIAENKGGRGAKTIALVSADDVAFGVARMFHAVQPDHGLRIAVFREERAASDWLRAQGL
jgi:hypothetical protein